MEKLKTKDLAIIAMDFKKVNEDMKYWNEQRLKKGNIYRAFSEYIICLENSLEHEENSYKRYLLQEEIQQMKKEQKKYYVPSILEMASYRRTEDEELLKENSEESNFSFVKKLGEMFKNRKCGNNNGESSIN